MTTKSTLHTAIVLSTQALIREAQSLSEAIQYDKAYIAYNWERSDRNNEIGTEQYFNSLNYWKNNLKADHARLAKVNSSLRVLKKMIRML